MPAAVKAYGCLVMCEVIMGKKYRSTPGLAALDMAALVLAYIIGYYVRFRTLEGILEGQLYRIGIVCLLLI